MKRSRLVIGGAAAVLVVTAGFLPVWTAEEARDNAQAVEIQTVESALPAEAGLPAPGSCEWQDEVTLEATGLDIGGRGCLSGGPPNNCDDYPVPYGGSCSCTSSLIEERCRECDTRKKGRVLETTCTVCPACYSPPCIPVPCNDFVSRTCSVS